MAQSMTNKSMGHAFVILLLYRKLGVDEFTDGRIVNPERALDAAWIADHPVRKAQVEEVLETEECPSDIFGPNIPQPQRILDGVPLANKDSQAHKD